MKSLKKYGTMIRWKFAQYYFYNKGPLVEEGLDFRVFNYINLFAPLNVRLNYHLDFFSNFNLFMFLLRFICILFLSVRYSVKEN